MCGLFVGGFWWIFPLVMCLGFLAMVLFASTGRGFMCMGGHRTTPNDHAAGSRQ